MSVVPPQGRVDELHAAEDPEEHGVPDGPPVAALEENGDGGRDEGGGGEADLEGPARVG